MNKFDRHAVPAFMQDREQFLLWGLINGSKVPLDTRAILAARDSCGTQALVLRPGNANDAHNYVSFDTALELLDYIDDPLAGLGYGFKDDDQVIGMDFDRVLKDGKLRIAWLNEWLAQLDTYVEVSPSGNGLHALLCVSPAVKAELYQRHGARPEFRVGIEKREKDDPHHHVFIGGGFLTLTTHVFAGYSELNDCTGIMATWGKQRAASVTHEAKQARGPRLIDQTIEERTLDALRLIDPDCDRDTWKDVAAALKDGAEGMALGWDLFHAWSRGDYWEGDAPLKYKGEPATRKVYDSFDGKPGVDGRVRTLATVFALASETQRHADEGVKRIQRAVNEHEMSLRALAEARGVTWEDDPVELGTHFVAASELTAEATRWLWTHVLPFGHFTLMAGDPGSGKSSLLLKIAADVSHAQPLAYDNEREAHQRELIGMLGEGPESCAYDLTGKVLYLTSEMHWKQTALPTLNRNNAVLENIIFARRTVEKGRNGKIRIRPFDLARDLEQLIGYIVSTQTIPDLIVIDPMSSFIGADVDRNAEGAVRPLLESFGDFCAKIGTCFVGVAHKAKNKELKGAASVHGSVAFVGVSRMVHEVSRVERMLGVDEWNAPKGLKQAAMVVAKTNISPDDDVHVFTIAPRALGADVQHVAMLSRFDYARSQSNDQGTNDKRNDVLKWFYDHAKDATIFDNKGDAVQQASQKFGMSIAQLYVLIRGHIEIVRGRHGVGWFVQRKLSTVQ